MTKNDISMERDGTLSGKTYEWDTNWQNDYFFLARSEYGINTIPHNSVCLVVPTNKDDTGTNSIVYSYDYNKKTWRAM